MDDNEVRWLQLHRSTKLTNIGNDYSAYGYESWLNDWSIHGFYHWCVSCLIQRMAYRDVNFWMIYGASWMMYGADHVVVSALRLPVTSLNIHTCDIQSRVDTRRYVSPLGMRWSKSRDIWSVNTWNLRIQDASGFVDAFGWCSGRHGVWRNVALGS